MDEPDQGSTIVAFYGFPDRLLQFRGQSTPVFGAEDIGPVHKCPAEVGKTLLRPYVSGHWHHEVCQTWIARLYLSVHRCDSDAERQPLLASLSPSGSQRSSPRSGCRRAERRSARPGDALAGG